MSQLDGPFAEWFFLQLSENAGAAAAVLSRLQATNSSSCQRG